MSLEIFRSDVQRYKRMLQVEQRRAFWLRLLTLGLANPRSRMSAIRQQLDTCKAEFVRYESLIMQARSLDDVLVQTVLLEGVRVSKHAFADVPVLDACDYGIDWEHHRDIVLERDDHECQEGDGYCRGPLQIHHRTPLSYGGTNDLDNLLTLCFYHHCQKHEHMRAKYNGSLWC